ncbi:phosphatase PAP2 family protein [Beijerinckia sp. L45]|uniref:phosphatase PAP2 family protein n=1 Tax=Beijerinckia sp. L45 TaxID=1641855 RepID=UPI00131CE786|nr:phosphatase PAP2 family protein [Beijerinckia sp. L45]
MTKTLLIGAALCAAALLVLALYPAFDLDVARQFYEPPHHFVADTPAGTVARYAAWIGPFVLVVGLTMAGIAAYAGVWPLRWAPRPRSLVFLVLSFALSPGLLVYGTFKPLAHRPRPHSVVELGGADTFRPFTRFDGACTHSCSFPSGETAGSLWTIAPASLVPLPWRGVAIAAAILFGAATGLLRIAFGGHFLSDVLGAAFFTLLSVFFARWVVLRKREL